MATYAKRVIESNKENDMSTEEIHREALARYKKVTEKIREIVGNKLFDEKILCI